MLTKTASQPPQAPPAPQRTMSQRATSGPPPTSLNKHRTSMFGTIKKRFSILTSSDSKTPTTPAKDAAPATPSKSAQPVVVDQAAVKALPAVPPSPVPVTVIEASPAAPGRTDVSEFGATAEPLRELPARTTSHTPPRPAVATFSPADAPPLMATPPGITRSTPQSAIPTSSSPQLTQTLSRDSGARSMAGSVGSINRRSSVKGPRPMPSSPESKGGVSIPNSDPIPSRSRLSNPLPVPSLPAGASPPQLQSFPLGPMVHARSSSQSNGSSNNPFPEIVTPSTPGEQSEYSVGHTHTTTTGTSVRLVSPSATPEEDRALFLSSSDNVVPPHVEDGHKVPTRESSGESLQPSVPA
ncbi:hypothetical protein BD324DRAFT_267192 [Kockovaella imperatae]|uniref:Uncharacterized protein n=1 Tax=Kockovaella imperatae TaxID=4999 RepID=A0A1Y1URZ7_9TREE|nr:hypothetical protein BD324DRAFT_267192 [Kockovaella imperatae]ORX40226.1 hypothetical protein BD324DRAFT_267192 [Kockovaella imperatae]